MDFSYEQIEKEKNNKRNKSMLKRFFIGIGKGFKDFAYFLWHNRLFAISLILILMAIGSSIDPISKQKITDLEQKINNMNNKYNNIYNEFEIYKNKSLEDIRNETVVSLEQKLANKEKEISTLQNNSKEYSNKIIEKDKLLDEKEKLISDMRDTITDLDAKIINMKETQTTQKAQIETKAAETVKTTETVKNTQNEEKIVVEVDTLIDDLNKNALNAKNYYKGKYVQLTGILYIIDASGKYIILNPLNTKWSFLDGVSCRIKKEHHDNVALMQIGDKITVYGKITDVGEILGYTVEVESFL